ncbi:hypothetical protein [Pedobacter sandarakinus]|uniref:hypothetical protein n=1 Tax=Pedobacter sandarakinus TaxID=353156 RepID=UPI002245F538|nr:hypothetical protein [Pedobacter sandarakinus]MCX2574649.1 hypothetical protein [Pedobacter sandarakinus]
MKKQIRKWTFRFTATGIAVFGILLIIVLNPILTTAKRTVHNNFIIYHEENIDPALISKLDQATSLLKTSEFYNSRLKLDICLNDGAAYPSIIKSLRGQAFAWGFYNKVVLQGTMNCKENYVELNGYNWNLTQLLAHEMTHCFQFDKLGFWNSKPVADIPDWKWEGYAEYVSRNNKDHNTLVKNINRLERAGKDSWEITLDDNTIAPRTYYQYWILVQYCLEIKKMSYKQLLSDTTTEIAIKEEMQEWYDANSK